MRISFGALGGLSESFACEALYMRADEVIYFVLRMLRKAFPWEKLPKKMREVVPGMRPNGGELSFAKTFSIYKKNLPLAMDQWLTGRDILEIGVGRTHGTSYLLAAHGARQVTAFEPYRTLDRQQNELQYAQVAKEFVSEQQRLRSAVRHVTSLDSLPDESFDTVLSTAVLEHVTDMVKLSQELSRLLKPRGVMLHIVDYRDHFFRYPYHHLLWSDKTWNKYLNPGDLPRWRISDHIRIFQQYGFETTILQSSAIENAFEKVKDKIHPRFNGYDEFALKTAYGTLFCRKECHDSPTSDSLH